MRLKNFGIRIFIKIVTLGLILPFHALHASDTPIDIGLSSDEKHWLEQNPIIHIGADALYAPIEMIYDGEHKGITADYFKLIGERLGVEFRLGTTEGWAATFAKAKAKQLDLLTSLQITEERRPFFNFTDPYIFLDTAIITVESNIISQELTINDMQGKRVAVVKGYFWSDVLPLDYPDIEIVEVDSLADGLLAVAFGQVDSMFSTYAAASYYIQQRKISNLAVSGLTPYKIEYAVAVRSNLPELVNILNKALRSITAKEKTAIENNWIALEYRVPSVNKKIIALLSMIAILIVLLILLWVYLLRSQVQAKTIELSQTNEQLEFLVDERTKALEESNEKLKKSRRSLVKSNNRLKELSGLDDLTQISNRLYLDKALRKIVSNRAYHNAALTVVMMDVDFFKQYNDFYGHLQGDRCLIKCAQTLKKFGRREGDVIARYGGEEFALVLPRIREEMANELIESALEAIRAMRIEHKDSDVSDYVTVSAGFVTIDNMGKVAPEELLQMADTALYSAKATGRNCFVSFSECAG